MNNMLINEKPICLREADNKPYITPFLLPQSAKHDTVLILPGGGYEHVSIQKEGTAIAQALNEEHFNAFVLDYRTAPFRGSDFIRDAADAVRFIRSDCSRYIGGKLAVTGFSAGGHLTLMEAQHWQEIMSDGDFNCRPDALILCYPVVTFQDPYAHKNSRSNFLGPENADDRQLRRRYSAEEQITPDFPSSFIWHCEGDTSVPVENSRMLRNALEKAGIDVQLTVYPGGAHGLGLAADHKDISGWFSESVAFLRKQGFK